MGGRVRLTGVLLVGGIALISGGAPHAPTGRGAVREPVADTAHDTARNAAGPAPAPPAPKPAGPARAVPPEHRSLRAGTRGAEVRELQRRLRALHYDPGRIDGRYGESTVAAVWAFEKVNHLKHGTKVGPALWSALATPRAPRVLVRKGPADRVEIDLRHQLLTVYRNRRVVLVSHVSSGSGELFCNGGRCRYAVTPTGDFRTGRRARGWETGPLGALFNPIYFNGGIAMHGALAVPAYPASHGCVRVPMHTAEILPRLVGTGERVYVRRPH